jgi:hypothetical protein
VEEPIIEAKGVRKIYEMGESKVHALNRVDLSNRSGCSGPWASSEGRCASRSCWSRRRALLGIGLALGGALSANIVDAMKADFEDISYRVPWATIGVVVAAAYVASLLTTHLPARQASRVYPAEALGTMSRDLATVALHIPVASTVESSDNRPVKFDIHAYAGDYETTAGSLPHLPPEARVGSPFRWMHHLGRTTTETLPKGRPV